MKEEEEEEEEKENERRRMREGGRGREREKERKVARRRSSTMHCLLQCPSRPPSQVSKAYQFNRFFFTAS